MNVANLQLEGLIMAVASINKALVDKGLVSIEEIDIALRKAEASLIGEERSQEELSPSHRDAVVFPVRILQLANHSAGDRDIRSFSELSRTVGQTKGHYNDQQ